MTATRRPGVSIAGGVLCVIAGVLLLIAFVVYAATESRWSDSPPVGRWILGLSTASALALSIVAVVSLVTRGPLADLLLLAATGWSLAWTSLVGPGQLPYTIEYGGDVLSEDWLAWGSIAIWVALGFGALLLIVGLAGSLRAAARPAGGVATTLGATAGAAHPGAGWHPDPAGTPGVERWWDGSAWTGHTR